MENNQNETAGKEVGDWTVMVYLGGDNNLSEECLWSIKEMFRIGLTGGYAVVAQYDSGAGGIFRYDLDDISGPVYVGAGKAAQGTPERRDDTDGLLNERHAMTVHERRDISASITALTGFVRDCVRAHPAKHYMLVLSGHAGGAVGHFLLSEGFPPGNFSIRELAVALVEIRNFFKDRGRNERLDILGLDACAMSMAEVGYELKGLANFMVGAEGFEPASGWPYHRVLEELQANSKIEPEAFARRIVERYITYYSDFWVAGRSTDQAACNLDNHEKLFRAIKILAVVLSEKIEKPRVMDAIILAHWRAQSYKFEEYVDLWDFCDLLARSRVDEVVTMACESVRDGIYAKGSPEFASCNYVVKSCYSGPMYQYSRGLSIYFPWVLDSSSLSEYQRRLFFTQDTNWGDFVEKYVNITRRLPRGAGSAKEAGSAETSGAGDRIASPADRIASPADRIASPADRIASPADRIASPADRIASPADRIASPADRIAALSGKGDLFTPKVKNPPTTFCGGDCVEGGEE